MLEVQDLSEKLGHRIAVGGVTFKVNYGDIVGYLGCNLSRPQAKPFSSAPMFSRPLKKSATECSSSMGIISWLMIPWST